MLSYVVADQQDWQCPKYLRDLHRKKGDEHKHSVCEAMVKFQFG